MYRGRRFSVEKIRYTHQGRTYEKEVVRHPGAVVILALTKNGNVVLEKQYRPALDGWIYELPAGTLEPGEEPEACAVRELAEETGYIARRVVSLGAFYSSPGYSDEKLYAFLAENPERGERKPEDYEIIEVLEIPLKEFEEMIKRGEIVDAKTLATYTLFKEKWAARNTFL